jgi:hypothetical protein
MQIGFNLPLSGALTSADAFTRLAVEGEAIGFDYIAKRGHGDGRLSLGISRAVDQAESAAQTRPARQPLPSQRHQSSAWCV